MSENPVAARSKGRLTAALELLLQEKDFDSITITELCAHAGLSRPAFYQNFNSTRDVAIRYLATAIADAVRSQEASRPNSAAAFVQACCAVYESVHNEASLLVKSGLSDIVTIQCTDAFLGIAHRPDHRYAFAAAGIADALVRGKGVVDKNELVMIVEAILG